MRRAWTKQYHKHLRTHVCLRLSYVCSLKVFSEVNLFPCREISEVHREWYYHFE